MLYKCCIVFIYCTSKLMNLWCVCMNEKVDRWMDKLADGVDGAIFMYMHMRCACVLVSKYVYTFICIFAHIHTYIHAYIHACIHTYMHTYMHAYIHACIHTCMHAYIHACIHTCMHTCIHTYIHTYIHGFVPIKSREFSWKMSLKP